MPALKSVDECVNVPSEVCAMSKVNPKKKSRPTIQKWCYKPEQQPTDTPAISPVLADDSGNTCEEGECIEGRTWFLI